MKTDEATGNFPPFLAATALAHTAPIYVTVQGTPPLQAQPRPKVLARK
jgi:hypothetical protein